MKTILLCGGLGTRLREETEHRPKPMVEIGERPILWHIMKIYSYYGYNHFCLCLGYKGEIIKDFFLNYRSMNTDFEISVGPNQNIDYLESNTDDDFKVILAETGQYTMTGGRIKRVQKYVGDEVFLATYGDGLADINIKNIVDFHHSHGRIATLSVVHPISRFGVVNLDGDRVEKFTEKPLLSGWINAGFYVFNKKIFDYLDGDESVLEKEPLERLAADGELCAYKHHGFFYPMDTYRDYQYLNTLWNEGNAPWKIW